MPDHNSKIIPSDVRERAHFWIPDGGETPAAELLDTPTENRMYIDQGEIVRVRVEADEFYDDEPGPPKATEGVQVKRELRRSPYSIIVRLSFWKSVAREVDLWSSVRSLNRVLDLHRGGNRHKKRKMQWKKADCPSSIL